MASATTDNGVAWVDHPASAVLVEDGAVVLLQEVCSLLFASLSDLLAGAPGKEGDND